MEHHLLLTLGHNSSAIIVGGSQDMGFKILAGYEEERLTLTKSDSRFPINAIQRCMEVAQVDEVQNIYITHWAVDGQLSSMSKKHFDQSKLPKHKMIVTHGEGQTHHDTHAYTATWYAKQKPGMSPENTMIFVVDGFGNMGEHFSIYKCGSGFQPVLVRRLFGYGGSMGLMYQYMTAFLGMKQHEDEYKILGYEAHIHEVDVDLSEVHRIINQEVRRYLDSYFDSKKIVDPYDEFIRLDALPALQRDYIVRWNGHAKSLNIMDADIYTKRVVMGYIVQGILEGVVASMVGIYRPTNLICTGGVFYNVKLGRRLLDVIPGKICVCPLAGDQGNAIGLFSINNFLEWPGHLNWGIRPKGMLGYSLDNMITTDSVAKATEIAMSTIASYGMVNIVRGAMEFGPRAMCNTSTIALPKPGIVNLINKMNGRNTIMPMAPVMNGMTFRSRMAMADRVHMSEQHMIITLPYNKYDDILGAAHLYQDEATGRPQVLDNDPLMDHLLAEHEVLINTSFNIHGRPIVYTVEDTYHNTMEEAKINPSITTIYLEK